MKIIHLCDITNSKNSGVSVIVPQYVEHQSKWADVLLLNVNDEVVVPVSGKYKNIRMDTDIGKLEDGFDKPDLIIIHDVYSVRLLRYYFEHIKGKYKYITIPHGALMKASQKKSRLKKMVANMLLYREYFSKALAVQYLSEAENRGSIHYNEHCLVIPNGISVPEEKFCRPNCGNDFSIVYVGRIAPLQKGLDLLIEAVAIDKDFFINNNIKINLYGSDYKRGATYLRKLISSFELDDIIMLNADGIYGVEKKDVLMNSDLFVQISRLEGMPSGILEALSLGLPVVVSSETGMAEDVLMTECGYVSKLDAMSILQTIKAAFYKRGNLETLSSNAYKLSKKYDWNTVSERTIKEYERIVFAQDR